jgi:hypothetical protein
MRRTGTAVRGTRPASRVRGAALGAALMAAAVATLTACASPLGPDEGAGVPQVVEQPNAQLTTAQRLAYEEDAVRLAIRYLRETGSPAQADVRPPAALVESLFNALAHVHAWTHPVRDSIVELYRIHSFPYPQTRQLIVRVDPAHGWTHAWRSLNAYTGNATVDALVAEYELGVVAFHHWSIGDVAVLRAARPLHAAALAARFVPIAGVIYAERDGVGGDGDDIRASRDGDGWRLDYSVGFGDCPSGCIYRYTWSVGVSAAGAVRYLGSSGEPPPPPRR